MTEVLHAALFEVPRSKNPPFVGICCPGCSRLIELAPTECVVTCHCGARTHVHATGTGSEPGPRAR